MGICVAYGVSFVLATTFQCSPIPYSWKQLDDNYPGSCNNIHIQGWMSAIFNIVIDLIILILPLKELYALQTRDAKGPYVSHYPIFEAPGSQQIEPRELSGRPV